MTLSAPTRLAFLAATVIFNVYGLLPLPHVPRHSIPECENLYIYTEPACGRKREEEILTTKLLLWIARQGTS